ILRKAARVVGKEHSVSRLENWIWWRFPIFRRYKWSAGEVYRVAKRKFYNLSSVESMGEAVFKSRCVRMGLRFSSKKTARKEPPLLKFVESVTEPGPKSIPDEFPVFYWPRA